MHEWMDTTKTPDERAKALVAAMTLEQKAQQLGGSTPTLDIYDLDMTDPDADLNQIEILRHVDGIEELGIPYFAVTNGPVGVGMGDGQPSPPATAMPSSMGIAATFDPEIAYEYGDTMGREAHTLAQHVLEAPGVTMNRVPIGGRNFEYFSEDPYLTGVMGVEVTKGIQANEVIAMPKHFVFNDQEKERFRYDVRVDEAVAHEIYLLPFEMCVKDGHAASIMASYQRFNGTYVTDSFELLTGVLREQWGFEGYVQSDFWATRSTAGGLNAGMDHEMPDNKWYNAAALQRMLKERILEIETIDRALVRRYRVMFALGMFDKPRQVGKIDPEIGGRFARRAAGRVITLLKNDAVAGQPLLPLAPEGKILILGVDKYVNHIANCGGGSSQVVPLYEVPPVPGMEDVIAELGGSATVESFVVAADMSNLEEAKQAAAGADTVVVMAGLETTEGGDQSSLSLPLRQDEMLFAVLGVNPRTVLVLKDGDPVLTPWRRQVPAILEAFNQGQEDGHAVADVLFGKVNPSAKLPMTYPEREEHTIYHGHPERYPGVVEAGGYPVIRYTEGRQIGYRWYQAQGVKPAFPFGFGLSYTTFELDDVDVNAAGVRGGRDACGQVTVQFLLENTGEREGAEVVQVYAAIPGKGQPPKRLVGFKRVNLQPGESRRETITIDLAASNHPLGVWDPAEKSFVVPEGEPIGIMIGNSSEHTPFGAEIIL
ncbi:beta-1,3-N-acetylglucosaminyltransferase [Actinobaculum suis]|uniref:beta-glucosidase n=1 Tax=Actinobaculum suis TaxID=1657 RepID=UPI00066FE4E1|nr:glycoside hydrolase family 3 C-terminal domain-containing protein [Actinobaculum suis]KMY23467.1 beta-1,3-N-acetylglucosaminyltransferase [Actinobaculum suis]